MISVSGSRIVFIREPIVTKELCPEQYLAEPILHVQDVMYGRVKGHEKFEALDGCLSYPHIIASMSFLERFGS